MAIATVSKQIASVRKSAAKKHAAQTERVGSLSIGDVIRQGDLYLVRIESVPKGKPAKSRQLAPGTTQGSRHVAVGDCSVIDCELSSIQSLLRKSTGKDVPSELIGPVVEIRGPTTIEHPEHGHKVINEPCTMAVVFQLAYGDQIRRVMD